MASGDGPYPGPRLRVGSSANALPTSRRTDSSVGTHITYGRQHVQRDKTHESHWHLLQPPYRAASGSQRHRSPWATGLRTPDSTGQSLQPHKRAHCQAPPQALRSPISNPTIPARTRYRPQSPAGNGRIDRARRRFIGGRSPWFSTTWWLRCPRWTACCLTACVSLPLFRPR